MDRVRHRIACQALPESGTMRHASPRYRRTLPEVFRCARDGWACKRFQPIPGRNVRGACCVRVSGSLCDRGLPDRRAPTRCRMLADAPPSSGLHENDRVGVAIARCLAGCGPASWPATGQQERPPMSLAETGVGTVPATRYDRATHALSEGSMWLPAGDTTRWSIASRRDEAAEEGRGDVADCFTAARSDRAYRRTSARIAALRADVALLMREQTVRTAAVMAPLPCHHTRRRPRHPHPPTPRTSGRRKWPSPSGPMTAGAPGDARSG